MINKIVTAFLLTFVTSKDALEPMEFFQKQVSPKVEDTTIDWVLGTSGFILGGLIESGANIGNL